MNNIEQGGDDAKPKRRSLSGFGAMRSPVFCDRQLEKKEVENASKARTSIDIPRPCRISQARKPMFPSEISHEGTTESKLPCTEIPVPRMVVIKRTTDRSVEASAPKDKRSSIMAKISTSSASKARNTSQNGSSKAEMRAPRARSRTSTPSMLMTEDGFHVEINEAISKIDMNSGEAGARLASRSSSQVSSKKTTVTESPGVRAPSESASSPLLNLNERTSAIARTHCTTKVPKQEYGGFPRSAFSVVRRRLNRTVNYSGNPDQGKNSSSPLAQSLLPPTTSLSKVAVVSQEYKIYVVDLLPEETCDWILDETRDYAADCRKENRTSWRKLYTHTSQDLPCCEVFKLRPLTDQLILNIREIVGQICKNPKGASALVTRSWKEPHLLSYGEKHTGMCMHYDGGALTWQILLSAHGTDYTGGGTYFRCLKKTVILRKGQVLIHPGNLYHRGCDITSGTRTLMVCFMDGFDMKATDNSDPEQDFSKYESNVVQY